MTMFHQEGTGAANQPRHIRSQVSLFPRILTSFIRGSLGVFFSTSMLSRLNLGLLQMHYVQGGSDDEKNKIFGVPKNRPSLFWKIQQVSNVGPEFSGTLGSEPMLHYKNFSCFGFALAFCHD